MPRQRRPAIIAIVVLILLGAFALRVFDIVHIPPFMHWDEGDNAGQVQRILAGEIPLNGTGLVGHPAIAFFQYSPYVLFGDNFWALRTTTALWSMLVLSATYFGTRAMFGTRPAIFMLLLMATAHMMIHFSRLGMYYIQPVMTGFLAFGLYLIAFRAARRRSLLLVLAGAALAYNLYQYPASRALYFGLAVYWLISLPRCKQDVTQYLRDTAVLASGIVLVAAPLLVWYLQHPEELVSRSQDLSIFSDYGRQVNERMYGQISLLQLLFYQTVRSLGGFFATWDTSPDYHFAAPLLDTLSAMMLIPGIILAWQRRPKLTVALLAWMVAGLIGGAILTIEPPTSYHYIVLVPLALVFVAVCFDALAALPASRVLLPVFLVAIGLLNIYLYFGLFPYQGAWYSLSSDTGYYVADTRGCCTVIYLGEADQTARHISAFIAAPATIQYAANLAQLSVLKNGSNPDRPVIIIIPAEDAERDLPPVKNSYPNGSTQAYIDRGQVMFYVYKLSP